MNVAFKGAGGGGGGGGLHQNSLEIDFIIVSDRGDLSDALSPMEKYCSQPNLLPV